MSNITKVSFLGDISLNDGYRYMYKKNINPFQKLHSHLSNSEVVIGNLESIVEGNQGENELKKPRLKTDVETLNYLNILNVNVVTLAHNHVYDNLTDGFQKTVSFLDENGIYHLGAGFSEADASKPLLLCLGRKHFCFLNYVAMDTNPSIPDNVGLYVNKYETGRILEDISTYRKKVDYIILLFHWGGNFENGYYPELSQRNDARLFIDAGADLIVGHHTHTLQPYEMYKGKYIFYSIGNFCFSDIVFEGKTRKIIKNKGDQSIILDVDFSDSGYNVEIHPIRNTNLDISYDDSILSFYNKRISYFSKIKQNNIYWSAYIIQYRFLDPLYFFFAYTDGSFWDKLKSLSLKKIIRFLKRAFS